VEAAGSGLARVRAWSRVGAAASCSATRGGRKGGEGGKKKMEKGKRKRKGEREKERERESAGDIRGGDRGGGRPRALRRLVGRRHTRSEEKKGDGMMIEIGRRDRDPMGNVSGELGLRGLGMIELNDAKINFSA